MMFKITVKGRIFATNERRCGVFELRKGAYFQHRGTSQAGPFPSEARFRRFVQAMLREGDPLAARQRAREAS